MRIQNEVKVDLVGGLGNQLFCYSAGRYLASRLDTELICISNVSQNSTIRNSTVLSNLSLPGKFVNPETSKFTNLNSSYFFSKLNKFLQKVKTKFINRSHYISKVVGYDHKIDGINFPVHLHGYFQSWKYAAISKETIRKAIDSRVNIPNSAVPLLEMIENEHSLVIHIRLGDYLNLENDYFGVLSPEYYENLLERVGLTKCKTFVFSDDIKLARKIYGQCFPESTIWIGDEFGLDEIETLALMSKGKVIAIANSTFSWWAAFLSPPESLVIAPSKWFRGRPDPYKLIPEDWLREESKWQ